MSAKRVFDQFRIAITIALAAVLATGCSSSPTPTPTPTPTGEAPDIPPASTMVIDFSDFLSEGEAKTARVLTQANWGVATTTVLVWNAIVTVTLAVPVAAFVESFDDTPTLEEDGTWIWSYDTMVDGELYTAELHALIAGAEIHWEMFISKEGEFENVSWFTGVSNLLGTEGTWTLNRNPDAVEPFIGIVWHRDPASGTADVTYTNIVPGGVDEGAYIMFAQTDGEPYDREYDIYNAATENLTEIEWNAFSKAGRIKNPMLYGDEDWHCWNETSDDIACEAS